MKRRVVWWELAGALLTISAGSALHFAFACTGYWRPMALLAAVNESVWEHLKMAFWPTLLFALVEYRFVSGGARNYWLAKCAGLVLTLVGMAGGYYVYVAIVGHYGLLAGVASFVIAIVAGQALSARLLFAEDLGPRARRTAIVVLVLVTLAFATFTYHPPRLFLFEHAGTRQYGILDEGEKH